MELDELKSTWAALDSRLKENELLNKRIIQKMLNDKSNKSLNKLVNYEIFSLSGILLVIPLCIWLLSNSRWNVHNLLFPKIIAVVVIALSVFLIPWGGYIIIKYLLKIDFSKSIKDNMFYINKFAIYYSKGKTINIFFIIPVLSLLGILSYYESKAPLYLWIFLFAALTIGIALTFWTYKKVYDANIQAIQKSLNELKELEEDVEGKIDNQ